MRNNWRNLPGQAQAAAGGPGPANTQGLFGGAVAGGYIGTGIGMLFGVSFIVFAPAAIPVAAITTIAIVGLLGGAVGGALGGALAGENQNTFENGAVAAMIGPTTYVGAGIGVATVGPAIILAQ